MLFDLNKIRQAYSQPTTYNWSAHTSQKHNPSNPTNLSTPRYFADSIADDFWRQSQESDANYYESQGYTFDGTKWVSPNESMSQRTAADVRAIPVNDSWFKGNRTYWENQAKNAYSQLNSDQRGLIDKDGNGSFSLEEIRDYQSSNGLVADGKLGNNTMARLNNFAGQTPSPVEKVSSPNSSPNTPVNTPTKFAIKNKDWHNTMTQAGGKVISVGNGDYGFLLNGNVYYNNGRMKGVNGKMSNYDYNVPDYYKLNFQGNEYRTENHLKADFNKSFEKYLLGKGEDLTKYSSIYGPGLDYYKLQKHPEYQKYYQAALKNNKIVNYADLAANAAANAADKLNTAVGNSTNYNPHRKQGFSNGGSLNKYQQGGSMNNKEEMQKAFMAFLIEDASTQGITIQSEEDLVKYTEALGEEGIKAKYQEFVKKMQGGIKAKYGAKLTQVRKLKGLCADDEELVYLKQGGRVCPVCQKKMKKNQNGDKLEKELSEIEKFKKQYKKDAKHPDEATKDSLLVNKYNDIEHLEKVEHKGFYVKGKWVPNRKNYSNKK